LPNCCVQKGEAEPKEVATMEYHSPYKIEITPSDIPSFIFSSGTAKSRQTPQYFDAETPTRCYSLNDAEILVKRVAKGLQSLGLRPSEKVLLFSGNRLHFPVLLWGTIAAECVFTGCTPSASVQGKSSTLFQSRVVVLTKFS
jgi:4-coumarate--CoA ligase